MNVFISYRHFETDQQFADNLVATLRDWGHTPWIDHENIGPGADWMERINQGLKTANLIVGILSDKSIESRMVLSEWLYALENKLPFILVRLRPCQTPYPFNAIQFIDYAQGEAAGHALLEKALKTPKPAELDRILSAKPVPAKAVESATRRVTNRAAMLSKVYDFWIKGVLEPAKLGDIWLDLPAEQRPETVEPEIKRDVRNPDFDSFSLGSDKRIVDVFHRMGNELLILGAPGAGKTITLLELARDLIAEAQADDSKPIPVVLNLSSWAEKHSGNLEDWLVERLFADYGVSRKFGKAWIENGNLLFLFDGLDEVSESYRDACVTAINTFWKNRDQIDNGIAVCSRIADYEALANTLHLENAIMLDALTPAQAEDYLAKLGQAWDELRVAIPGDPVLHEFAGSPLLLNFMAVAYRDTPHEQIVGLTEADQKRQLFDRYVVRRLRENAAHDEYPNAKTRHYLGWLAGRMVAHKQTVFQVEGLQPDWLAADQRRHYQSMRWLSTFWAGLFFGLFVGLYAGLYILQFFGLFGGLIVGVIAALVTGWFTLLFFGLFVGVDSKITVKDRLNWSLSLRRKQLVGVLVFGLVGMLGGGLFTGLVFGPVGGLVIGPFVGLFFGLVGVLLAGITISAVEYRTHANEGIWRSQTNWLFFGLFGTLFGVVFFAVIGKELAVMVFGLLYGLLFGLLFGLSYGGGAVIKHALLRRVLYRANLAPRNYASFLDYCVSHQLLRRVGGGYIFRHRMLMEYFAEKNS